MTVRSKPAASLGLDIDEEEAGRAAGQGVVHLGVDGGVQQVTVASKVRPRPSAVTTPPVAAPGRVRLARASRTSGDARPRQLAMRAAQAFRQQPQQRQQPPTAPPRNSRRENRRGRQHQGQRRDAQRGAGRNRAIEILAVRVRGRDGVAEQAGGRHGAGAAQRRHGKGDGRQQAEGRASSSGTG